LTQLEARLNSIEQLRSELDNEAKSHGDTNAKLDDERRAHKETQEKTVLGEKQIKQLQDQLASEGREKAALQKQLEAERKSRLHILSDFESERKQREHLIKQLEAEQKLRQSLQKAVSTKEELRLKAEEEIERLNQDIQEMMDEIDRLKTFEPPEKSDDNKVNVKLFLEDDIRFLELDPDVSYEELIIAVGKVFIESYVIKFEVGCARACVCRLPTVLSSHALRHSRLTTMRISAPRPLFFLAKRKITDNWFVVPG
jgi:chromosome segregation ATPase